MRVVVRHGYSRPATPRTEANVAAPGSRRFCTWVTSGPGSHRRETGKRALRAGENHLGEDQEPGIHRLKDGRSSSIRPGDECEAKSAIQMATTKSSFFNLDSASPIIVPSPARQLSAVQNFLGHQHQGRIVPHILRSEP
jgi:hypothetical protein